jgi:GTPase SAR1 family protein
VQVAEGLTIDCSIYHAIDGQHRQGEGEVVCPLLRSTTRQASFEGSAQPGRLVFVLDNRFSWMKSKDIKLIVRERPAAAPPATAAQEAALPAVPSTSVEAPACSTGTDEAEFSLVDRMDGLVEDEVALVTTGASAQPASVADESVTVTTDSAEQAALRRSQQLLASLGTLSAQAEEFLPSDAATYKKLQSWTDALRRLSRPYTLAFVGGFNVGKTSVINTLLQSSTAPDGTSKSLLPARMMPTTSVNVYLRHCVSATNCKGQLSYYRVKHSVDSNQSQANLTTKQVELSECDFRNLLDLNVRAEGSSLESHASGAGGGAYSLAVEGDLFAPGCFGDYLQDRLTLIDTRGDGDVRSGTLSSMKASGGDVDEFDAVVCVLDAQRIGKLNL